MSDRRSEQARIQLRGYPPTSGTVELTHRTVRTRLLSAIGMLVGFWMLAPIVFLVPPHLPWALAAIVAGLFMAYRRWTGEYVIHSFDGSCPGCAGALTMKPDQYVRLPYTIPCYACHQEPDLRLVGSATT